MSLYCYRALNFFTLVQKMKTLLCILLVFVMSCDKTYYGPEVLIANTPGADHAEDSGRDIKISDQLSRE